MPAAILHAGATVLCAHGGQATATAPSSVVLVAGMPIATIAAPYAVAGCSFPGASGPCVTGLWLVGSLRVLSQGQLLALTSGVAVCIPTGTPLLPVAVQTQVLAM